VQWGRAKPINADSSNRQQSAEVAMVMLNNQDAGTRKNSLLCLFQVTLQNFPFLEVDKSH